MPLTAEQRKKLYEALLSAFPTPSELDLLVRLHMGLLSIPFEVSANHPVTVFNLIVWAQAHGPVQVEQLVREARLQKPNNTALKQIAQDLGIVMVDEDTKNIPMATQNHLSGVTPDTGGINSPVLPPRKPVAEMSGEDLSRLIALVQRVLPRSSTPRYSTLEQILADLPLNARTIILGKVDVEGGAQQVAADVVMETRRAGRPVAGRTALAYLLRGMMSFLGDTDDLAWLDSLFLRYALDEHTASRPLPENDWQGNHVSPSGYEIIVGENTLQPVYFLSSAAVVAEAVVHLRTPVGMGTGFMVGDGLLLTCHHVLPKKEHLASTLITFNYQFGPQGELLTMATAVPDPNGLFFTSPVDKLDITIFAFRNDTLTAPLSPNARPLPLRTTGVAVGDRVSIIQHPNGGPKMFSMRNNIVESVNTRTLQYTTSTLRGSSGAPVLDDQLRVVGVHSRGSDSLYEPVSKATFKRNEGTALTALLSELQIQTPDLYAQLTVVD